MIDTSKEEVKIIYQRDFAGNKTGDTKYIRKDIAENLVETGIVKIIETIKTK